MTKISYIYDYVFITGRWLFSTHRLLLCQIEHNYPKKVTQLGYPNFFWPSRLDTSLHPDIVNDYGLLLDQEDQEENNTMLLILSQASKQKEKKKIDKGSSTSQITWHWKYNEVNFKVGCNHMLNITVYWDLMLKELAREVLVETFNNHTDACDKVRLENKDSIPPYQNMDAVDDWINRIHRAGQTVEDVIMYLEDVGSIPEGLDKPPTYKDEYGLDIQQWDIPDNHLRYLWILFKGERRLSESDSIDLLRSLAGAELLGIIHTVQWL
jgi:hypothetical protein